MLSKGKKKRRFIPIPIPEHQKGPELILFLGLWFYSLAGVVKAWGDVVVMELSAGQNATKVQTYEADMVYSYLIDGYFSSDISKQQETQRKAIFVYYLFQSPL